MKIKSLSSPFITGLICVLSINIANSSQLIRAAKMERLGEVKEYIKDGLDLNFQDCEGNTPLIYASWEGNCAIIEELVNSGADIDLQNNIGQTPLMIAVLSKKRGAIIKLLNLGANPNIKDRNGNTAFMIATFLDHPKVSADILKIFLCPKYNINLMEYNNQKDTLLLLAVNSDRYYLFEAVMGYINKYACTDKFKILNHKNVDCYSALTLAAHKFNNPITICLINNGADIESTNKYGNTPLMVAALNNNITIVDKLLSMNADINHQNNTGHTALMFAASEGRLVLTNRLLCGCPDLTLKNMACQTARDLAIENKFSEIAKLIY